MSLLIVFYVAHRASPSGLAIETPRKKLQEDPTKGRSSNFSFLQGHFCRPTGPAFWSDILQKKYEKIT